MALDITTLASTDLLSDSRGDINTNFTNIATDLDALSDNLENLTDDEVTQLEAIDATTISATQWAYLGDLDQALKKASSITFANLTLSGLTASELTATDANKKLQSLAVATYPSLTELSYIKGLTSAIQTQLGDKAVNGANTDITSLQNVALYIGRDADNKLDWATDNYLKIKIGGVEHDIASISTGVADNDKLVTQGYVDDNSGGGALADLSDVVSATNTDKFALMANGTTGYVGRALVEADISDLGTYAATNQQFYIGTTQIAINRASAALTLAGITLTTPDIGTPSAGTLTNCTFPTLNQNTTGTAANLSGTPNLSIGTLGCGAITTSADFTLYEATNDANPEIRIGSADANEGHIQAVYDSGAQTLDYLEIKTDSAGEGDIVLSPASGFVGIGIVPAQELHIADTASNCYFAIQAADTSVSAITFANSTSLYRGSIRYDHSDEGMKFYTGGDNTLALTLDSSQNATFAGKIIQKVKIFASDTTPDIDSDFYDAITITAQTEAITDVNVTGTPTNFQKLIFRILDDNNAGGYAITWGADFEDAGVALPIITVANKLLTVGFIYNTVTSKWGCVAAVNET